MKSRGKNGGGSCLLIDEWEWWVNVTLRKILRLTDLANLCFIWKQRCEEVWEKGQTRIIGEVVVFFFFLADLKGKERNENTERAMKEEEWFNKQKLSERKKVKVEKVLRRERRRGGRRSKRKRERREIPLKLFFLFI